MSQSFSELYANALNQTKRKVFISYHHKDQAWVDYFRSLFSETYDILTDCSLDEAIESNDLQYVHRTIREEYITGTSITIVICGNETHKRKCVDWEIHSTLNKDHALLAIPLTHSKVIQNGKSVYILPDRLYNNIMSDYAHWIEWTDDANIIKQAIERAITLKTANSSKKQNSNPRMIRNLS